VLFEGRCLCWGWKGDEVPVTASELRKAVRFTRGCGMCRPPITPLANLKSKPKHRVFSKNDELDFIDYTYNGRDSVSEHIANVGHESTLIG
jgi:hypothetical protein